MDRLDDIEAFLAVAEKGSQTAAARHLRRSLQSINRSLAALERSVGVELVRRTTRHSHLTDAGRAFYERVKPALAEINDARLEAAKARGEPSGLLRIAAPVFFAPAYVVPAIAAFMERHPGVEIELKVSDRMVNLLEDGIDVAVRIREMADSSLMTRRLGELRVVAFGSPDYFARHGRPQHPDDLVRHECVLRHAEGRSDSWTFRVGGRRRAVRVQGRFGSDSAAATHAAVAAGLGIGLTPLWQIRGLVDAGAVEVILEDFEDARIPIHAVWPAGKIPLAKTRLFVDELAARLKRESL
ncbi:transcriptional regulator, LysR family [Ancylobacter novellus DSM 506]|uniref:Transcriptional regulator, LysR family n=1 Tax=Ancylobacter novellus (strain ATCC 8093 / DSM 506 / JCM 20403 / CCM 1077 / IAM 12100 / NBRC 12443 / NCIMB 10456) TaxID=639283 RepID=D6ZYD9_ANCN5|nr:LysR family transcriptional regulator [Ancylobacter novellus]ADH89051.1 transcriptional regulator, LysR family [Ancylobacter novellus DSM 506]